MTETSRLLVLVNGHHHKGYIQSAENIIVSRLRDFDAFVFTIITGWVRFPGRPKSYGEPFLITPDTDLSQVPRNYLEQLYEQMYYEGENDDDRVRFAKFSKTRENIFRHFNLARR